MLLCMPSCSYGRYLEILAAGDVTPAWRMLEEPVTAPLFSLAARQRISQAHVFLWNCEASGPATYSKPNQYLFHADSALLADLAFPNAVAITANNHVFDGYQEGAANLLSILNYLGIRHNGLFYKESGYKPQLLTQPPLPVVYLLTGSPMSQRGSGPDIFTLAMLFCWKRCAHYVFRSLVRISLCMGMMVMNTHQHLLGDRSTGQSNWPLPELTWSCSAITTATGKLSFWKIHHGVLS